VSTMEMPTWASTPTISPAAPSRVIATYLFPSA
jgi:hypothetical protein